MTEATKNPFYITTPIYYVNGEPHLGHAYTTIACDVMARFKRLDGHKVHFLTGTDEHGIKVHQSARAAGMEPQAFADQVAQSFKDILPILNISNDDFIRTTEERHKKAVQHLWIKLQEAGAIYKSSYSGWYAVRDEAYYAEDETELKGDGKRYAISSGAECTWMEEESYFFKLSEWGDKLLAHYAANPDFIQPEARKNEIISFVKSGLKDLSISRTTFDWGIPVPNDPKHVMYVWIDALANYITALGYPDEGCLFTEFWQNKAADTRHVVGKEIIRFHCVYWPAFLWAAGLEAPDRVFAHGWWTVEGQKMSKSVGNVIAPQELIARYGVDGARWALLRDVPFGNDGNFSHEIITNRINSDLANGLGNLAQRTLSMINKNCGGTLPEIDNYTPEDMVLLDSIHKNLLPKVRTAMDRMAFHEALDAINDVINAANKYVDDQAPWKLKKENPHRMEAVLYVLAETIRGLALIVQPFMPASSAKLLDQLVVPADKRTLAHISQDYALEAGIALPEPQGVFPRLEMKAAA